MTPLSTTDIHTAGSRKHIAIYLPNVSYFTWLMNHV